MGCAVVAWSDGGGGGGDGYVGGSEVRMKVESGTVVCERGPMVMEMEIVGV